MFADCPSLCVCVRCVHTAITRTVCRRLVFILLQLKRNHSDCVLSLHASTMGMRGTFLGHGSLPRAQHRTLQLIIVVGGPESVLPDVLAIHTVEMIPKSMILTSTC